MSKLENGDLKTMNTQSGDQTILGTEKHPSPCLVGYKDKRTGICYYNVAQQTEETKKEKREPDNRLTRETQLCEKRNQCWNTTRETWTQMDRSDLLLDTSGDYAIYPRHYEDSKLWSAKRNKAATTIQQYARRRIARNKFIMLQKYVQERSEEIKFLQAIDRMKSIAAIDNQEERIKTMMCKMSALKSWELSNGKLVHVQTPATLRASDLMRLYTALAKCSRTVDERMCVLGYIKWTVQEFDCSLTKELIQLIEREADLMYRNRPAKCLLGLRRRILYLFLKFIQVPQFNPEATAYQCVPIDFDHSFHQSLRRRSVHISS